MPYCSFFYLLSCSYLLAVWQDDEVFVDWDGVKSFAMPAQVAQDKGVNPMGRGAGPVERDAMAETPNASGFDVIAIRP